MYETNMNMKKIILFGLLGLLLAACSVADDESADFFNDSDYMSTSTVYEGVWSINDVPVEQTFSVVCYYQSGQLVKVAFPTFPLRAVAESILTESKVTDIDEENDDFAVWVSMVGNSAMNNYYNADQATYQHMSFGVITQDQRKATLKLNLNPANSVFSFSNSAASCVLAVERAELTYEDGEHKTLALNPARKLTFVSTKRM